MYGLLDYRSKTLTAPIKEKRKSKTMGNEDIKNLKVTFNPVYLTDAENKARLGRLARLLLPYLLRKRRNKR